MLVHLQLHNVSTHLLAHFLCGSCVCKGIICGAKDYSSTPSQDLAAVSIVDGLLFVQDDLVLGFNGLLGRWCCWWTGRADNFKLANVWRSDARVTMLTCSYRVH